ncbi:GntR family transcriptional regulator [Paenibacillus baekrokdamisoli]|uniref:GntR family transcriptional regulator n=1 Tax=Paenibacillus baekrokdamisoli TaxID=1712516 RepID=A0A3G9IQQ7_9BACL|nr:GntR family transcriptional regulator [Paenibacillus baekrokdamisoli]MBB3070030.1 DNA-binding GntR family transcriptional regulator [Paenibacillus baekrokdamisoli]BBH20622.1 GntR family transcriptional regulator [Paenibacillus baekrokdamisoli]
MATFHFKNQENLSLRQRVMSDIRNAIIQGHLKPGDKLRELDISQQMAISRGPIREALRDLEALGLVVSSPYRETTVADVSKGEVVDLLIPIRLQLEIYALKQIQSNWNDAMYQSLRDIVNSMKEAADNGDLVSLVEADIRFHESIVSSEDSPYTQQIWSGIVNRLRLHFIKNTKLFVDLARVPAEHEELLQALQNEPFERVKELWTQHILQDDCLLCFHDGPSTNDDTIK